MIYPLWNVIRQCRRLAIHKDPVDQDIMIKPEDHTIGGGVVQVVQEERILQMVYVIVHVFQIHKIHNHWGVFYSKYYRIDQ